MMTQNDTFLFLRTRIATIAANSVQHEGMNMIGDDKSSKKGVVFYR